MDFPGFLNDIIFKFVFGTQHSEPVLCALLNALLGRTGDERLVSVKLVNPNLDREHDHDKAPELDVLAVDDEGRKYNIEVQIAEQTHFRSRSVYYAAKVHGGQLKSGEKYHLVVPTIGLCLLGYTLSPLRSRLHSVYRLRECTDGDELVPDLEMHYIELSNFHELAPARLATPAEKWLHVLKYLGPGILDLAPELKAEEGVEMAIERAGRAMSDEEVRTQIMLREKAAHDEATRVYEAELRGRAEGLAEGRLDSLVRPRGCFFGRDLLRESGIGGTHTADPAEELNDDLELHFIDVEKFRTHDPTKLGTSAEKWMHMLRFGEQFGDRDLPPELQ